MKALLKVCLSAVLLFQIPVSAYADVNFDELVGYRVVYIGHITGYQDPGKRYVRGEFEGCEYDRKIFIDDKYRITCAGYGYSYSYLPKVVILTQGLSCRFIVGDELYKCDLR